MISELGRRPMLGSNENAFGDELEKEIGLLLREQRREDYDDREKELNIYRSGSAPPTVEGSLSAVGGLFGYGVSGDSGYSEFALNKGSNGFISEEELRSDPSYLSYYYSNVNLNPRLPPPLLSKEDWRFAKRLQGGSSAIGDRRKVNRNDSGGTRTLLSMPPGFSSKKQDIDNGSVEVQGSVEWGGDGLIGLPALELGSKQKNLAEIFQGQDDLSRTIPVSKAPSRPASRNALDQSINDLGPAGADMASLRSDLISNDPLRSSSNILNSSAQLGGQPASYSYAAALGASLSRSTTPDPQAIARAPSPGLPPIGGGRAGNAEKRNITSPNSANGLSHLTNDSVELVSALSGMSLANGVGHEESHFPSRIEQDMDDQNSYLFNMPTNQNSSKQHFLKSDSGASGSSMLHSDINHALQGDHRKATVRNNSYRKGSSASLINGPGGLASQYQQLDSPNSLLSGYNLGGYPVNPLNLPPLFENAAAASAMGLPGMDARMLGVSSMSSPASEHNLRMGNQMNVGGLQSPYMDPAYMQYLSTADYLGQVAALNDPSVDRNYMGNLYADLLQKAYLNGMLSPQKASFGVPGTKHAGANHPGFYGNPAFGLSYPGSPLASPLVPNSPAGPGSPMRPADFGMRYTGGMKNAAGGVLGPWHLDSLDKSYGSTLLEEFKSNKTKCFELTEIAGHVVEFSADQYGSRFIQQKLETATTEEKNMVFDEINPHALTLMTDVFGNYVIQKFFEHGMSSQRRELARKLIGNVLAMSLQMYGCRVIQKALEVVDEDQKIQMVKELDGHIMRCVRDQNGNHVIQKCIECVPEDHIQFIVSTFFGQVVTLSTHPYGCRVIQRVLEHCSDAETQSKVMEEILGSVSMLAQDQYGNYVIQHVLEHGKPDERTTIIQELAGKIVEMSQQKFASNVVEKCLTFGDPSERLLLVNEMLGTTDENEPLQAMMKDQFANYVVQKVLETCSDQQREFIMSRIKVHLNALKKYTYGKHIVARVEKLLAAGERRIAASLAANPA